MKIGIVHSNLDVIGGAEKTTLSLIDALRKTNHVVTLYTTSKNFSINSHININRIYRIPLPFFWRYKRMMENEMLFKRAKNDDIIIIMSGGLTITQLENKKMLVYCHSTFETELNYMNSKSKGLLKFYNGILKKKILEQLQLLRKDSVKLIANSGYTRQKISHNFAKDSIVIFPPVEIDRYENRVEKRGVITISRYSPEKKLEFAINVMKNIPLNYKIIGNAKFQSHFDVFNQLSALRENNLNIELLCNVKREILENTLLSSKVYFHTSEETFGISVVESIAAGCIPIVPDNSAHKETVPFSELRYSPDDISDARKLVIEASNGVFDEYLPKLKQHIKNFHSNIFQEKMLKFISEVSGPQFVS